MHCYHIAAFFDLCLDMVLGDALRITGGVCIGKLFQHSSAAPSNECRGGRKGGRRGALLSGSVSATSYVSFVASVITLVLNLNNNLNANNNNNNRLNVNHGSSSNAASGINQNVGNDFNIMLPPGRKKKRRRRRRRRKRSSMLPGMAQQLAKCLPGGTLYDALLLLLKLQPV